MDGRRTCYLETTMRRTPFGFARRSAPFVSATTVLLPSWENSKDSVVDPASGTRLAFKFTVAKAKGS